MANMSQAELAENWRRTLDRARGILSTISWHGPSRVSLTSMVVDGMPIPLPDPSRYPHVCPRCSGPAYVGAVEVDCARGCK